MVHWELGIRVNSPTLTPQMTGNMQTRVLKKSVVTFQVPSWIPGITLNKNVTTSLKLLEYNRLRGPALTLVASIAT